MDNREINRLIAAKVMGWTPQPSVTGDYEIWLDSDGKRHYTRHPLYGFAEDFQGDIAAAWLAVEKLMLTVAPTSSLDGIGGEMEKGLFWWAGKPGYDNGIGHNGYGVFASTAPRAVCFAALKTVGVEVSDAET